MLKKNKQKKESEFSKKWAQVEKKKARNLNFRKKIDVFYEHFQKDILPFEVQICEMIAEETRHLMSFLSRKSFTQWQREELTSWIESNLDTLSGHPFSPDELSRAIHKEYSEHLIESINDIDAEETIDPLAIIEMRNLLVELELEDNFSDEQLAEFIRDPQSFHDYIEKLLLATRLNEDVDDHVEDDFINGHHSEQSSTQKKNHQNNLKDLFNGSLLKKCYKKLANILHPDKELNVALKDKKSHLMAMLVQAKKENDAFTILSMYKEHVPDSELNLGDDVSHELTALIDEKLKQLDKEYFELKHEPNIKNMVWDKLGGRSKNIILKNKRVHLSELQQGCAEISMIIDSSKNMKQLNKLLSERYDQGHNNFSHYFDLNELMSDICPDDFFKHFS